MVVLGIDAHKRSHTLVAVDEVGRRLATQTVAATDDGHHSLITWARRQFPDQPRIWAVEDCRVAGCGGDGLFVSGASAGLCALLDAS